MRPRRTLVYRKCVETLNTHPIPHLTVLGVKRNIGLQMTRHEFPAALGLRAKSEEVYKLIFFFFSVRIIGLLHQVFIEASLTIQRSLLRYIEMTGFTMYRYSGLSLFPYIEGQCCLGWIALQPLMNRPPKRRNTPKHQNHPRCPKVSTILEFHITITIIR